MPTSSPAEVVVGSDAPTGVVLELNLRDPDQARAIADALTNPTHRWAKGKQARCGRPMLRLISATDTPWPVPT
jgi:hypothetical protein